MRLVFFLPLLHVRFSPLQKDHSSASYPQPRSICKTLSTSTATLLPLANAATTLICYARQTSFFSFLFCPCFFFFFFMFVKSRSFGMYVLWSFFSLSLFFTLFALLILSCLSKMLHNVLHYYNFIIVYYSISFFCFVRSFFCLFFA